MIISSQFLKYRNLIHDALGTVNIQDIDLFTKRISYDTKSNEKYPYTYQMTQQIYEKYMYQTIFYFY